MTTEAEPSDSPLALGSTLGSYRILSLLGEGGMGFVYRGEHARIGRRVAIKVLRPDLALRPDVVARFFGEARSVNQIRHAHIIDIHDFVELDTTRVFIVMELLEGCDLKVLLDREGALPPWRVASIGVQITDALTAVHERGIVHRDLKPENIYLVERGSVHDFVKLLDFGIAKLQREPGEISHTQTGSIFGTPQYMSPEQARGLPVDFRSDVYSVGMILYTLLAGQPAFDGVGFGDILMKQIGMAPAPLRPRVKDQAGFSFAFERAIMRALEKDREARFQTMAEMRDALVASTDRLTVPPSIDLGAIRARLAIENPHGEGLRLSQDSITEVGGIPSRRRWPAALVVLATGALVFGGALALMSSQADDQASPAPAPAPAAVDHPKPSPAVSQLPPPSGLPPLMASVRFVSDPIGADVIGPDGKVVCRTPCAAPMPVAATARRFRARKEGFRDGEASVTVSGDARVEFPRLKTEASPHSRRRSTGRGGGDTLNPFR